MRYLKWLVLVLSVLLLSACQTVPLHRVEKQTFAVSVAQDKGQVRITGFHIPKDEPGTKFLLVLAAVGGGDINYPVFASLFDVTDETSYLGTMQVYSPYRDWLEYEVLPGKRTFMLMLAGKSRILAQNLGAPHVDFIEVEVKPGRVNHIALSRYGFSRFPYLGEVEIADKHRDYCLNLTGAMGEREKMIGQYMADNKISASASTFKNFCRVLSNSRQIQVPNEEARKQFADQQPLIETLRKEAYEKWKAEAEKRPVYDLLSVN